MATTTFFMLAAVALLAIVLAILLPPLWRVPKPSSTLDRREANLDIYRSQLTDLERDHQEGALAEADFAQARTELQRRMLDELENDNTAPAPIARGGRKTALALLVALPLAAVAGYVALGKPQALEPAAHTQAAMASAEIEEMLGKLASRLKENPQDTKGWIILARSYKALGRLAESAEAYSHGGELLDSESMLLADYADVLVRLNGGQYEGKPGELIDRALKMNPDEPMALYLAGAAGGNRQDYAAVVHFWERLMPQLEAGSDDALNIGGALDEARKMLGIGGAPAASMARTAAPEAPPAARADQAAASAPEAISGEVVISGEVAAQTKPDDTLFIFARAGKGSRMPLAVMRLQVADLPFSFKLDDSMGLPGGQKISDMPTVVIEARVAKAGMAQSTSGDLFGVVEGVKPGSKDIKVVINQIQE